MTVYIPIKTKILSWENIIELTFFNSNSTSTMKPTTQKSDTRLLTECPFLTPTKKEITEKFGTDHDLSKPVPSLTNTR